MVIYKRFHRNKYTVNTQLQSHIEKHSDLRTLKKMRIVYYREEKWDRGLVSVVRKVFTHFVHFAIILRNIDRTP